MATKKTFYELTWPDEDEEDEDSNSELGVARALRSLELWLNPDEELLPSWIRPTLYLLDGPFVDFLVNDLMVPMCSEKMCNIIEEHHHPADKIEWLPVEVTSSPPPPSLPAGVQLTFADLVEPEQPLAKLETEGQESLQGDSQRYYILHLLEELDVIDWARSTTAGPGYIAKPHLDLTKVGEHQIFRYKGGGDITFCISNRIRLALLERSCTGCGFWEIPAS